MDTLLNWTAQGIVVAVAAAIGLRLMPPTARARSRFAWAAYLLVAALPILARASTAPSIVDARAADGAADAAGAVLTMPAAWWTSTVVASGLWIAWSAVGLVRFVASVFAVRRARRDARPCPDGALEGLSSWRRLTSERRPVPVVLCERIRFAAVLGCGRPVIALSPALLDELSAADLDRVLTHEWAHVDRRDDVAQIVQRLIHVIVGWHPAAWWLARQLEFEREAACDELAVAATGSAKAYAACLTALAALPRPSRRPLTAVAALSSSRLERRLRRILAARTNAGAGRRRTSIAFAAVVLAAAGVNAVTLRAVASAATWIEPSSTAPANVAATLARTPAVASSAKPAAATMPAPAAPPNSPTPSGREDAAVPATVPTIDASADASHLGAPVPMHAAPPSPSALVSTPIAAVITAPVAPLPAPAVVVQQRVDQSARAAWSVAADAGVAIGRSSQSAGVATAGFFSRFGKRIARSF